MPVPVHELAATEDYLAVLDGHPEKFAPGERFAYCNGGYVVLALIAERASGMPFHELVRRAVCEPAGMHDTAFLRSDELPGRTALGYLEIDGMWRSNVFHLPVRGTGDGGIYTTAADVSSFWRALFAGRIVSAGLGAGDDAPRSDSAEAALRARVLAARPDRRVMLEGCDAGVSFRSATSPTQRLTYTVLSNTTDGAWPIVPIPRRAARLDADSPLAA